MLNHNNNHSDDDDDTGVPVSKFAGLGWGFLRQQQERNPWKEPATIEEKRKLYTCGDRFVTLNDIPTFTEYAKQKGLKDGEQHVYKYRPELNEKISIWRGDMTHLEIDSVVNAANNSLLGGGGIDGSIHRAAGPYLREYNATLGGCKTGETKISPGFKLPAKWILSTVGPVGEDAQRLQSCYETCLELVLEHELKSVAFCCISTGIFGYPLNKASQVALHTVRQWMEKDDNYKKIDRIIFVVFLQKEEEMYNTLVPYFFPLEPKEETQQEQDQNSEDTTTTQKQSSDDASSVQE